MPQKLCTAWKSKIFHFLMSKVETVPSLHKVRELDSIYPQITAMSGRPPCSVFSTPNSSWKIRAIVRPYLWRWFAIFVTGMKCNLKLFGPSFTSLEDASSVSCRPSSSRRFTNELEENISHATLYRHYSYNHTLNPCQRMHPSAHGCIEDRRL